mmetsp:Transcript_20026/g.38813  ORF Transcript_20026/g.38813 Transcript_20026/m.38813 type:complete len:239 (-) Transcript_20026:122-838(-)
MGKAWIMFLTRFARFASAVQTPVALKKYGVLGSGISVTGSFVQNGEKPNEGVVIVDPAGLHHIHGTPYGAGGAAGSIYKWLGIYKSPKFPLEVQSAIAKPTDAKFHRYDPDKLVIHAVGPDFRKEHVDRTQGVALLAATYANILREYQLSRVHTLRLLPVSGGIFAGPFKNELPEMTREALQSAVLSLPEKERGELLGAWPPRLEMCIFAESEYPAFAKAFAGFGVGDSDAGSGSCSP